MEIGKTNPPTVVIGLLIILLVGSFICSIMGIEINPATNPITAAIVLIIIFLIGYYIGKSLNE